MVSATQHPTFGTCLACTQAVRLTKTGRVRRHSRTVALGHAIATVHCMGSQQHYAEALNLAWAPGRHGGKWVTEKAAW